jgi:hypothetical protein
MTCPHVLDLIDAGPFANYPRAELDAAWEHARSCGTCGPALQVATALKADLAALPQPAPPAHLAAVVLARIAQLDPPSLPLEKRSFGAAGHTHSADASVMRETRAPSSTREWPAWATSLGGIAAGLVIVLSMPPGVVVPIDLASPRVVGLTTGLVPMPSTTTGAVVLAAGLVLYLGGLFAPFRGRTRR